MSFRNLKALSAVGACVGFIFIAMGIYSFFYFFTGHQQVFSTDIYGNYFMLGLGGIIFGAVILRGFLPAFIPLKKNNLPSIRTCPHCGAIVDEDDLFCKKCKQQLGL